MMMRSWVVLACAVWLGCSSTAGAARARGPAADAPRFVVVLGCQHGAELEARVAAAAQLVVRQGREAPVVIASGGARLSGQTEADVILGRLARRLHGRPLADRLMCETASLDTVGNAIFTALLLRARGWLGRAGSRPVTLLVVTSDFHAHRAEHLFRRVFPPWFSIGVASTRGRTRSPEEVRRRAAHERASEERSAREIFGDPPLPSGRLDLLLERLVKRHGLYRGRSDLLMRHRSRIPVE